MAVQEKKCKLCVNHFRAKSGRECFALFVDTGYAKKFVSFDPDLCAAVLGISAFDLPSIPLDTAKTVTEWVNK